MCTYVRLALYRRLAAEKKTVGNSKTTRNIPLYRLIITYKILWWWIVCIRYCTYINITTPSPWRRRPTTTTRGRSVDRCRRDHGTAACSNYASAKRLETVDRRGRRSGRGPIDRGTDVCALAAIGGGRILSPTGPRARLCVCVCVCVCVCISPWVW